MTIAPGTTDYEMTSDVELKYTRVFDAPHDVIYAMFTKPEHLTNWMGMPDGTMKIPKQDLRVSGEFRWEWYEANGELQVAVSGEYKKIVPNEYIENTEIMEFGGVTTDSALCSLTFSEADGQTTIVGTIQYPDAESAKGAIESGMKDGMNTMYDRLDEVLAAQA